MQSNIQPGSLGSKFQDYGAYPSDALWGNIEAALEEKDKKRRGIIWWWIGGATAAAAIVAGVIMISTSNFQNGGDKSIIPVIVDEFEEDEAFIEEMELKVTEKESENDYSNDEIEFVTDHQKIESEETFIKNPIVRENLEKIVEKEITKEVNSDPLILTETEKLNMTGQINLYTDCDYPRLLNCQPIEKTVTDHPWEIGFNVGYYLDGSRIGPAKKENTIPTNTTDQGFSTTQTIAINQNESLDINTSYNSGSVSKNFNVSGFVGKYFQKRMAWRIGLDFSRTTYSIPSSTDFAQSVPENVDFAISSIGVPISLKYDFVQRERFKLRAGFTYLSEIPIYENIQTNSNLQTLNAPDNFSKFTSGYRGALQFEMTNDIRIGRNFFLSVTPSYRYYMVEHVNSIHPLIKRKHWFGANVGLTWEL